MADPIGGMKAVGAVPPAVARPGMGPSGEIAKAFGDFLKDAVQSMETQKASATALQQEFAAGGPVDVSQVTIAMEQA
ncbi:MAG: flagellar hook-basal body complex protein FliE, partial [bacterium]